MISMFLYIDFSHFRGSPVERHHGFRGARISRFGTRATDLVVVGRWLREMFGRMVALQWDNHYINLSCPGWLQKGLLPIFKNTKKNTKQIQPKNTKSELQGLENTTGWFCIFFCILVPDFQK